MKRASGLGRASAAIVAKATPSHAVSNFDHRVTQWMSVLTVFVGSAVNCPHVSSTGFSTRPKTLNRHFAGSKRGGVPTCSTGKSRARYWPGGNLASVAASGLDIDRSILSALAHGLAGRIDGYAW